MNSLIAFGLGSLLLGPSAGITAGAGTLAVEKNVPAQVASIEWNGMTPTFSAANLPVDQQMDEQMDETADVRLDDPFQPGKSR